MAVEDPNDLRRALENNEIIPYFQPLVELRTGLLSGFEALARWQHPERGLYPAKRVHSPRRKVRPPRPAHRQTPRCRLRRGERTSPATSPLSVNISLTQLTDLTLPRHILRRRSTRKVSAPPSHPRDHRERTRRQHRTRRPHRKRIEGRRAPVSHSTTSAPAIPASATFSSSPSTNSRLMPPSSAP